jgi:hypothetical protein
MTTTRRSEREIRGIGFAILLLSAGLIWLLYNFNLISTSGINVAFNLWPLALIALGADLLLRAQAPRLGALIVALIALGVIVAAVVAPRLGIGVLKTTTDAFTESLGDAESAIVNLYPSVGKVDIYALDTQDELFRAEATYIDDVTYTVRGTSQRQIEFGQKEVSTSSWLGTDADLRWNIGLTPTIPLRLSVNTGVGEANLNLSQLNLTSLTLTGGVGRVHLALPDQDTAYQVSITGGVGDLNINLPTPSNVDLNIGGGVGKVDLELPDDAAVRVTVSSGFGSMHLPSWLERTNTGTGAQVWETSGYQYATRAITIFIQSGVGGLTIR